MYRGKGGFDSGERNKIAIFGVCRSRTNIIAAAGRCECAAGDEVQG